jgi:hypothetical protein
MPGRCRLGSLVCLASAFGVYLLTLAPAVQGFDSAELTVGARALGFVHAPGYPLYMLLGHAFAWLPLGDVGQRLNLMSALFASLTVLVLFQIVVQGSGEPSIALPAVLLFATTPLFWSQALRAEVYTLHLALMVGTLYLWRRAHEANRPAWYAGCFLLLGLGLGNHPTTVLLWASLAIAWIWETGPFRRMGMLGTAGGIGVAGLLYLYFPLRSLGSPAIDYVTPYFHVDLSSLSGLWWLASAQMFRHEVYWVGSWLRAAQEALRFGSLLLTGYLGVGGILGLWGWWRLRKKDCLWNRLLTIYFVANVVAFAFYHVADKAVMFVPAFAVWAIWVASGIQALVAWLGRQLPNWSGRAVRFSVSALLLVAVGAGMAANWQSVSLHGDRRALDFASQLLANAEPSALVVNGWATASVLDYLQLVEGRRPDVQSFNLDFYNLGLQVRYGSLLSAGAQAEWRAWLEGQLRERPVCFVQPLPAVPANYEWARQGACWQLLAAAGD